MRKGRERMLGCVYLGGNTEIFYRMVRQCFIEKVTFDPRPKGSEALTRGKKEHSEQRKQ